MEPIAIPTAPETHAGERLQPIFAATARAGLYMHVAFLPIGIAPMQIGLGIAGLSLLALRLTGRRVWTRSFLDLPVLALIGAACASQILAFSWVGGNDTMLWRTLLAPLVIVSVLGLDPARARSEALRLFAVWGIAALAPSLIAWIQQGRPFDPLFEAGLRKKAIIAAAPKYPGHYAALGFFTWYQRLAHNLTPPLLVLAGVALYGRLDRGRRVAAFAVCAVVASAVFFTFARTSWFGLAVAGVVLAGFAGRRRAPWILAAGAAIAVAVVALHPGVRGRVTTATDVHTNQDRIGIWRTCETVMKDHPIVGVGFGNLPKVIGPYFDRIAPRTKIRAWCHNTFFTAYVEGGALLALAVASFFALLARGFWKARARSDAIARGACVGALGALAAMLVHSMAHDFFYASESMYGFGFGLAIAAALALFPAGEAKAEGAG
ncbi:MAG TPA: O-antigen ligase family protein [Vulgatibacter sp.]|nr:O-antigen ligase family protein [Vulgatibacter sp.]